MEIEILLKQFTHLEGYGLERKIYEGKISVR